MSKSILIFGRQPELGMAEAEALIGASNISWFGKNSGLIKEAIKIEFSRLGGSIKLAKVLDEINQTSFSDISNYLLTEIPKHACCIPDGKLTIGLSFIGFNLNISQINKLGIKIKQKIKLDGRACRIVPNKTAQLSSAQIVNNNLITSHKWELILVKNGDKTLLARTANVQDIYSYSKRDFSRPRRDLKTGMLPPKLAQILINLLGEKTNSIFDPFCGTGVILQEALLMNKNVYGSDISEKMIDYSIENLKWLENMLDKKYKYKLFKADASNYDFGNFINNCSIATEVYLGPKIDLSTSKESLITMLNEINKLISSFLLNISKQTHKGFNLSLAVPIYKNQEKFLQLELLENLTEVGYTLKEFKNVDAKNIIYIRKNQYIGRQIIVLERI